MTRRHITSGSHFEAEIGFSRAVVVDGWVFVSGTTGYDYAAMTIAPEIVAQCRQALVNIRTTLEAAGAGFADVVRVRYILRAAEEFPLVLDMLRAAFGPARPAATMIVAGLADPAMRIEIELTARLPAATEQRGEAAHPPP